MGECRVVGLLLWWESAESLGCYCGRGCYRGKELLPVDVADIDNGVRSFVRGTLSYTAQHRQTLTRLLPKFPITVHPNIH